MRKKDILSLLDVSEEEARLMFFRGALYKRTRGTEDHPQPLTGKTWALVFSKPSTRTRVSFEIAIREMGGQVIFLDSDTIQLGRGEPIRDTARVLGRMVHGAVIRTFDQQDIVDFAEQGDIPTINALSDEEHPAQILADVFTFEEKREKIEGKKVAYVGDAASNVARSWAHAAEIFKFEMRFAAPEGDGCSVENPFVKNFVDPQEAVSGTSLVYTDVWVSMGQENDSERKIKRFADYQLNHSLIEHAEKDALIMHCLPAYRGKEITNALLEEHAQDIFDQAENRLHVQKGILDWIAT